MRKKSKVLSAAGGKFGILLVALVALMASAPVIIEKPVGVGVVAYDLFASAVLVASLHAARPGGTPVAIGLILALTDFGIGRLATFEGTRWLVILQILLWLSTLIFVTATILEAIFESEDVTVETLQESLCVYLLLGLIWVFAFALIEVAAPGSFQSQHGFRVAWSDDRSRRAELMRLSVLSYSTLAGSGTGDLTPSTEFANMAVALEAMMGQIYLAVVLARLVGVQAGQAPPGRVARADETGGVERAIRPGPGDSRRQKSEVEDERLPR
ncbi:MAG: hypothetical protein JO355_16235 [Planctomycetaceae bacterium]|nr:hypothetical protein [Planctomycetaceae bacterium]MBV8678713.1 hypothetical protein [Planctomycetaceae bacterium]